MLQPDLQICRGGRRMGNWEWSDVRCFLAVARSGSTAAAARQLGINQTTCARRVGALERALGVSLFERLPGGYALTGDARRLLPSAEAMAQAALAFEEGVAGIRREAQKVIRVTAIDAIVDTVVLPAVATLQARRPDVRVELDLSQRVFDLVGGEADVALRASKSPPDDASLVARRLGTLRLSAYCAATYAERAAPPRSIQEFADHPIIALEGRFDQWYRRHGLGSRIIQVVATLPAVVACVRMGMGVALLPRILAEGEPGLVRCFDVPEEDAGLWLIYPERLRGKLEIREFSRAIAQQVEAILRPA